jgi:hypothetical protein
LLARASGGDASGMSDLVEYPQGSDFPGVIGRTSETYPAGDLIADDEAARRVLMAQQ